MKFLFAALTLPLALLAVGCNPMSDPKHPELNPHPKQVYEITVTIDGAPGPFDSVTGGIGYQITNAADCAPQDPFTGVHYMPGYGPPLTLKKVSDNVYSTTVYLDLPLDGNYYGKGICHWAFNGFSVTATVHGANFFAALSPDETISGKPVVGYQQKRLYLDASATDMNIAPESISDEVINNSDKYFTMTLVAKDIGHE